MLPLALIGLVGVGTALASPSASTVTIKAATSSALGTKILVSSSGLTLYHYVPEKKGTVKCTGACAAEWPPVLAAGSARPVAGAGVTAAKLGTIKRPDGRLQVTYNGLALYRYADDKKGGQAKGQGEAGIWYAVTPAGTVTKAHAEDSSSASTSAASTSSPAAASSSTGAAGGGGGAGGAGAAPAGNANCAPGVMITDPANPCYNY
jgi:predicted lipoprotein with Yx(FWY)xxD motif